MPSLKIGVLSLQGCVQPHRPHIESLDIGFQEIKTADDLEEVQGLILPGGESTTLLKLIDIFALEQKLQAAFRSIPVWGICAGAILMARQVSSPSQKSFGILDIQVERNSYGRQLDSFHARVENYPVAFIRAPKILSVGKGVQIRASQNGFPIWVQSGLMMATTFHPELTLDSPSPMHRIFGDLVRSSERK